MKNLVVLLHKRHARLRLYKHLFHLNLQHDTVSLSNRLYFTTSKNKQRYNKLSKNPSKQEPPSHFRPHMTVNYFKETDGPDKKNNYKLGGKKNKERKTSLNSLRDGSFGAI